MIAPAQIPNPYVKPRWQAPVGVMSGVVAYNCRKYGMPRPVLAMPLWEGAGNRALDLSGYGTHGTINGSPVWRDGLNFADNEADYVELSDMQKWTEGVTDFSIVTDTTWGSSIADETIIDFCDEATGMWYLDSIILFRDDVGSARNDCVSFFIGVNGSVYRVESVAGIAQSGVRQHIVATFGGGNMRLYIDGSEDPNSPTARSTTDISLSELPWIGKTHGGAGGQKPHCGNIKYLYFYDVCLSASQIKFLSDNPYFMYRLPEELYGYAAAVGGATIPVFIHHYNQMMGA